MSIKSKLKKEGIQVIEKLDTQRINKISINVASRLCLAFPEHNFNRSDLFESISRLSMYIARMPEDSSGAKYLFKNNSIYFNESLSLEEMSNLAIHECIHFIQHLYISDNYSTNIGLFNLSTNSGVAMNEAAVQLMAAEANFAEETSETYYGISIRTISPDYYPLECTLMRQISSFTGTYPLYHSVLYGNDIFKNTFMLKSSKKNYNTIVKNFDNILSLENNLEFYIQELQCADSPKAIKTLNNIINNVKKDISNTFFKTQNLILESCFKSEFNNIRNLDDIKVFNRKLYNFKNIIGYSDTYTFYNEFYIKMMNLVQKKRTYIEKYGELNLFEDVNKSLMIVDNSKNLLSFINRFITKAKKLVKLNQNTKDEIDF